MTWDENLYALYEREGGTFLGTLPAQWGERDRAPEGVLLMEYRDSPMVVCGAYEVNLAGNATSVTLWTRILMQVRLKHPVRMELKNESLIEKGLGLLESWGKKEEDWQERDWRPEGYTVTCGNEPFAKGVLASQTLRRALALATEKSPVRLPLRLRVEPVDEESELHVVETATDRFRGEWTSLKVGRSPSTEENRAQSIELLQRFIETGKAFFDAVRDVWMG